MVLGASPLAKGGLGEGWGDVMFVPYHRFVLHSRLSPHEALRAMFAQTSRSDARWFRGEVDANGFRVSTALEPGTPWVALMVIGRIQPDPQGSRIVVSMRLSIGIILFLSLWLAIPASAALAEAPRVGVGAWLTAVSYGLLVLAPFWYEAIRQKRMLRRIFREHRPAISLAG